MLEVVTSFALVAALSGSPSVTATAGRDLRPISVAAATAAFPAQARASSSRDSLKNGLLIGAISGAVLGGLAGYVGCGVSDLFAAEHHCGRETIGGIAAGAALGALVGVGIDALFEQAPGPLAGRSGRRSIVRIHLRF